MNELTQIEIPYNYHPKVYTYQRNSKWYWKYNLPGDVWHTCFASENKRTADRNASLKLADLAKGLFNSKEIEKMQKTSSKISSIDDAISKFLDAIEVENSQRYFEAMSWELNSSFRYFKETLNVKLIHKIKEDHVYQYRHHLLSQVKSGQISQVTAKGKLKRIKQLFKWLRKRKMIVTNPCLEVESIKVDHDKRARSVATPPNVVEQLLAADYKHRFDFPIKELVLFLFSTGARLGEALHLEVDDLDLQNKIWKIEEKKDCPTKYGLGWSSKTSKSRMVPLSDNLIEVLTPLIERANQNKVIGYIPDTTKEGKGQIPVEAKFIFTMRDRSLTTKDEIVYRRVNDVRGAWGGLFAAAGLATPTKYEVPNSGDGTRHGKYKGGVKVRYDVSGVPFTRHDMRRGFNAVAEKAGMELKERCAVLGHNPVVNQIHYGGEKQIDHEKIARKVNELSDSVLDFDSYRNRKIS
jgi:site-specific recombinase XerD